jgi:transposase
MEGVPGCPGCAALVERLAKLEAENAELKRRLEALERAGKRQAAPFSRGEPKVDAKRPGRKSGREHGRHGHRPPLADGDIDEEHEAPLPSDCPHCHGPLVETHIDRQEQTEIPSRPMRRRFHIHCGRCQNCGHAVRGRHALQTSDATGSAASQIGPDAQAAVVYLNKQAGLSHGKVADVMTNLLRVPLTRGASAQIVLRAGRRLEPAYQQIRRQLRDSPSLTPDETGWRVGGKPAWLHAWVGDGVTCYDIDPKRSADALQRVIGVEWGGVMTHDGYATYDRFTEAIHQQCVAHVLRRAHDLEKVQPGRAKRFPRQVIGLFQEALAVRDQARAGKRDEDEGLGQAEEFTARLEALTARRFHNEGNRLLAQHLEHYGACWFNFVVDPHTPATNYQGEQAIRPAVVNRKVWGGNRTPAGAQAQAVAMSVIQTCQQQTRSALSFISNAFRGVIGRFRHKNLPSDR